MNKLRLENWAIVVRPEPYQAPETMKRYLTGEIYNHNKFQNGERVTTSSIKSMNDDGSINTSSGSKYYLGVVSKEYEKLYPNAFERLSKVMRGN